MNANDPEPENPFLSSSIGLTAALASFTLIGLVCVGVFCIVRTWFAHIYSPRRALKKGRPPKLPSGGLGFAWIGSVWSVPESFILRTVGLDGVMFLRFLKTSTAMFVILSLLGLSVIMPTNFYSNPPTNSTIPPHHDAFGKPKPDVPPAYDEKAALKSLTIENVPYNSPFLRIHLLFTWIFSLLAYACLVAYYRSHVNLKHHYAANILKRTSLSKIEYRSIFLVNLPSDLQQEVELRTYFENLEIGPVENVVVCRHWFKLREAVKKRLYYLQQIERLFADCVRSGVLKVNRATSADAHGSSHANSTTGEQSAEGNPSDVISIAPSEASTPYHTDGEDDVATPLLHYTRQISHSHITDPGLFEIMGYLNKIKQRHRPTHHTGVFGIFGDRVDSVDFYAEKYLEWDTIVKELRMNPEQSPSTGVAFVTFDSPQSAALASQIMIQKRPFICIAKMAPEPRDVYWPNLSSRTASASIKTFRWFVMNSISILIFLSSILWVAFSSSLPNWTKLPFLEQFLDQLSDSVKDALTQVVPVALFTSWTSSLPYLLLVICQLQGYEAQSWIEQAMFSKYYTYQIFNILLYIAGLTVWRQILDPTLGNRTPLDVIGDSMPKSSSQIIAYVLIQCFAINPAQLLQIGPLIYTWLVRNSPWSRNSPRDTSDAYFPSLLSSLNYGVSYTIPAVIWVVGLTYSCIAPLILPFCACFFFIAYFVNKYILLYVHVPKYETSGMHVPIVVTRLLYGVLIFQITMMGVLAIKYGGSWNEPGKPGEWSNYAQMVIGVFPLLIINALMYWWFQNGYEKLVMTLPMEVIGKVLREVRASENGELATPGAAGGGGTGARNSLHTPKLRRSRVFGTMGPNSPQSAAAVECLGYRNNLSSSESLISSRMPTILGGRLGGAGSGPSVENLQRRASQRGIERIMSIVSDDPEVTPVFEDAPESAALVSPSIAVTPASPGRRNVSSGSVNGPTIAIHPIGSSGSVIVDYDDDTEMDHPESGSGTSSFSLRPSPHLEPPAFRVPGILDAPFASGAIPKGDEQKLLLGDGVSGSMDESSEESRNSGGMNRGVVLDATKEDLQNYTYIHPALIGRLPVAWLDLPQQPESLDAARTEQVGQQKALVRRIIGMQRAGAEVLNGGDGSVVQQEVRRGRSFLSLRPLVDGLTGWAYMNLN
ncbi:UNVERIFIED_CONTAM: hypothetical protein HDU68_000140 [Siphonaria sp. JEL0065]|nr:hypothetical protein HDU68_000140 [Siphonaria sp. JEL0065]